MLSFNEELCKRRGMRQYLQHGVEKASVAQVLQSGPDRLHFLPRHPLPRLLLAVEGAERRLEGVAIALRCSRRACLVCAPLSALLLCVDGDKRLHVGRTLRSGALCSLKLDGAWSCRIGCR